MCFCPHDPDHQTPRHRHKVAVALELKGSIFKRQRPGQVTIEISLLKFCILSVSASRQGGDVYSGVGYGAIACLFVFCLSNFDSSVHWSSFFWRLPNKNYKRVGLR